ncbi:MAG: PQQ-binding-like beta-propeller repeat protein, partial [Anaerolineae bacterium]
ADGILVAGFCTGWMGFESEIVAVFLDAASGEIRWTRPLANGGVVGAAGDLVTLNDEAGVLAIDVETGGPTWRVERGDLKLLRAQALAEDVVLILEVKKVSDYEESRSLAAYNLADGSLRWVLTRPDGLLPRATAGGRWFDISDRWTMEGGQLLAFDVLSGQELWTAGLAGIKYGATYAEITAHEDKVFVFGTGEEIGLTAYEAATGYRLWTALEGVNGRRVAVLADTVYLLGTADEVEHLYALNPANGAVEWSGFDGLNIAFMAADRERLYLVTSSGLYADAVLTAYEPRPR